jgi:hypothetical protein
LLLQVSLPQTVPTAYFWHEPLPSHFPFVPHEVWSVSR